MTEWVGRYAQYTAKVEIFGSLTHVLHKGAVQQYNVQRQAVQ